MCVCVCVCVCVCCVCVCRETHSFILFFIFLPVLKKQRNNTACEQRKWTSTTWIRIWLLLTGKCAISTVVTNAFLLLLEYFFSEVSCHRRHMKQTRGQPFSVPQVKEFVIFIVLCSIAVVTVKMKGVLHSQNREWQTSRVEDIILPWEL